MRAPLVAVLVLLSPLLTSCADMPTAPRAMVPVSGTILDRDGNPLQAVYVFFEDLAPTPKGTYPPLYDAVTNITGAYSGTIPEGRYNIYISPPSFSAYAPLLIRSREIGRAGIHLDHRFDWVRIALRPTISGGQPVSALQAMVWPDDPRDFIWQRDLRLAGNEREVFVPPGTYVLYMDVNGKGFSYPHQERRGVTVSADTTIDVAFSGNAVAVHVTGQGGLAHADAFVRASGGGTYVSARADATGTATLYVPTGTYRLMVSGATSDVMGRELTGVPIAGDASFDFDLSGTVWTGIVRRAGTGAPVEGAAVRVFSESAPYLYAVSNTGADGAFHFIVETGRYYELLAYELVGGDAYAQVARIDSLAAGADSTFDIPAGEPQPPPVIGTTRVLPAAPGAPASAAVDPASRRRSFRTGG